MDTEEAGVAVSMPVEQMQIALFAFAAICIGLAVYLAIRGSTGHG